VAAVAVIAIVATILVVTLGGARPAGPSDEEQIRAVVDGFEEAWNRSDFEKFTSLVCAESLNNGDAPAKDEFMEQRRDDGRIELTVTSVDVHGEKATAKVDETNPQKHDTKSEDLDLVRENGKWKACFS
jgi:hypothetical protein